MPIPNAPPEVVAVGASAGGVEALKCFAAGLPPGLPYAVLVVLHMPINAPSVLARILDRSGPLPATDAVHGEPLAPGTIRVAVPNRHLLVDGDRTVLSEGPTENGQRPAINALFRSVASACGHRAIGVLLSGVLDDGTSGLAAIRSRHGTTIAQLPDEALFPAMPRNAIDAGVIDHQTSAGKMGQLLMELAERDSSQAAAEPVADVHHAGIGDKLLQSHDGEIESALRVAVGALQEKAVLARRLADQAGPGMARDRYQAIVDEAERAGDVLSERLSAGCTERRERDE
ncbi:chemotaxis protein CheB [Mycobacterium cookii]|uniref:protein-glutamate methylesterase n=1 Tax=Mycobacterium cookii TaxID=1775 RepID=A0A7I7KWS5_9MYCO|nr:chemotaxis protein CheB [Mycobacterium cookii]MCV7332866.1 chemotaxis protein CheB [Mycobacterium cookii]BBX46254.1 chemotaxis protein CheB [Mycobacterium cookii]